MDSRDHDLAQGDASSILRGVTELGELEGIHRKALGMGLGCVVHLVGVLLGLGFLVLAMPRVPAGTTTALVLTTAGVAIALTVTAATVISRLCGRRTAVGVYGAGFAWVASGRRLHLARWEQVESVRRVRDWVSTGVGPDGSLLAFGTDCGEELTISNRFRHADALSERLRTGIWPHLLARYLREWCEHGVVRFGPFELHGNTELYYQGRAHLLADISQAVMAGDTMVVSVTDSRQLLKSSRRQVLTASAGKTPNLDVLLWMLNNPKGCAEFARRPESTEPSFACAAAAPEVSRGGGADGRQVTVLIQLVATLLVLVTSTWLPIQCRKLAKGKHVGEHIEASALITGVVPDGQGTYSGTLRFDKEPWSGKPLQFQRLPLDFGADGDTSDRRVVVAGTYSYREGTGVDMGDSPLQVTITRSTQGRMPSQYTETIQVEAITDERSGRPLLSVSEHQSHAQHVAGLMESLDGQTLEIAATLRGLKPSSGLSGGYDCVLECRDEPWNVATIEVESIALDFHGAPFDTDLDVILEGVHTHLNELEWGMLEASGNSALRLTLRQPASGRFESGAVLDVHRVTRSDVGTPIWNAEEDTPLLNSPTAPTGGGPCLRVRLNTSGNVVLHDAATGDEVGTHYCDKAALEGEPLAIELSAGKYTVRAVANGLQSEELEVEIGPGRDVEVELEVPLPLMELE